MFDLLTDPVIRVDGHRMSLTHLLAALAMDGVTDYPGIRAHQRDPWHVMLVQLAVVAVRKAGQTLMPTTPDAWHVLLAALTEGHPFAWHLHAPEPDMPAFFQPPVNTTNGWDRCTSPAAIDAMRGVKEFDLKIDGMTVAELDQWMFGLITLQTVTASNGPHYGQTSRVRGGYGGRLFVGLDGTPGARFCRDAQVILSSWDTILADYPGYRRDGGLALTWLVPFDGIISMQKLDPMYLDTPRRVRLDQYGALTTKSPGLRTLGKTVADTGRIGDPWTVLNQEGASLNVTSLSYRVVAPIITNQGVTPSLLQTPRQSDLAPYGVRMSVLTGGQPAKTTGFHERTVEISQRTYRVMQTKAPEVAKYTKERIEFLGIVQGAIRSAILRGRQVAHSIAAKSMSNATRILLENWSRDEDARFFPDLFAEIENETDGLAIRGEWIERVIKDGRAVVRRGCEAMFPSGGLYWQAIVQADGFYTAILNKHRVHRHDDRPN
jgi:CRISPR system Cascade subunit CasA